MNRQQNGGDELAAVRHLVAITLAKGFGSDEEEAAEQALVADYFRSVADPVTGQILIAQPVQFLSPAEALAAMRVLRLIYGQRQLMGLLDEMMPEKGFGASGLLECMTDAIETLLTMLTAYQEMHGDLPPTPGGPGASLDQTLAAVLQQMGGGSHA
jgi:hypothetical protein